MFSHEFLDEFFKMRSKRLNIEFKWKLKEREKKNNTETESVENVVCEENIFCVNNADTYAGTYTIVAITEIELM